MLPVFIAPNHTAYKRVDPAPDETRRVSIAAGRRLPNNITFEMMTLQDLFGVRLPIIQATVAGVQRSELATAVSNAEAPEDMARNVRYVADSEALREGASKLIARAIGLTKTLSSAEPHEARPARGGRTAHQLDVFAKI